MSNEMAQNFTSLTAAIDENSESLGNWFARTRISRGLDQRDIAHHLGLSLNIVQAIESNAFEQLGPTVFARSYISRYAQLLKLPEQTVLERYRQQSGVIQEPPPLKVVHPTRHQTRTRDLRGLLYLMLTIGIGWTAMQYLSEVDFGRLTTLWSEQGRQSSATATVPSAATTTQVQYPFQSGSPESSTITTPVTESPSSTPAATASSESASAPATAGSEPPSFPISPPTLDLPMPIVPGVNAATAAPTLNTPPYSELGGGPKLVLEFNGDCWVEVKDSQGKVLANALMRANTTSQLSGTAPFTITLGNAPAAHITLDGKAVDRALYVPKRGTVSRFTLNPS